MSLIVTPTDGEKTVGEIGRSLDRIEDAVQKLTSQMQIALAPIATHSVLIDAHTKTIDNLSARLDSADRRLEAVHVKAAWIAGVIAGGATVIDYLLGRVR